MKDQDLLGQLSELAAAEDNQRAKEQEGQIGALLTLQGQISSLVVMLRSKGIFSLEDVKAWEKASEESSQHLHALLRANSDRERARTPEEAYQATRQALMSARQLASMISADSVKDIDAKIEELEAMWKQENS